MPVAQEAAAHLNVLAVCAWNIEPDWTAGAGCSWRTAHDVLQPVATMPVLIAENELTTISNETQPIRMSSGVTAGH